VRDWHWVLYGVLFSAVLGPQARGDSAPYPDPGGEHWIREIDGEGKLIELEDRSLWVVSSPDTQALAPWIPASVVTVQPEDQKDPDRYQLTNTDTHQSIDAHYVGRCTNADAPSSLNSDGRDVRKGDGRLNGDVDDK